jgi:uncharacterized protein
VASPFLSARWHDLVAFNWRVAPELLAPYVPPGTELDFHEGETFVSLVAFTFANTKFLGLVPTYPVPTFQEVNLRLYVKRNVNGELRRAVTFIKEIVPSRIIASVARSYYEEPYVWHPMNSKLAAHDRAYGWLHHTLSAQTEGEYSELEPGSHAHFILEHYWGYNARRDGRTTEYRVEHPRWQYREAATSVLSEGISGYYGGPLEAVLTQQPHSVLVARGSDVTVSWPTTFRPLLDVSRLPGKALGYVLYDGACGFCSWWIPFWQKTIQRTGYDIAMLQEPWVQDTLRLPPERINSDIRLLRSNGQLLNGADAYLFGMRRVWWSSPLGYLLSLPGFRALTWLFYAWFNRSRFAVSRACRLPPRL